MFTVILRFTLLGSFVGGGVFLTARNLAESSIFPSMNAIAVAPIEALALAVLSSFLSVPLGLFPAVATGAFYWLALDRYTQRNPRPPMRIALGGGVGLLFSTSFGLLFSFSDAPSAYPPVVNLFSWACAGVFAGSLSALTIRDATYTFAFGK